MAGTRIAVSSETPVSHPGFKFYDFTAATYREISRLLVGRGFGHCQYSDWTKDTTALDAYLSMVSLMDIEPLGKFQSTLKSVKVHYLADPAGLDGTDSI